MAAYAKGKQYGPINGRLAGHPVPRVVSHMSVLNFSIRGLGQK